MNINLYNYIKKRSRKKEFHKYFFNHEIEEKLNMRFCSLYNYVKNRSLKKVFNEYFYNDKMEQECPKDELPENHKIKNLIKQKKYTEVLKLLDIEKYSNKINVISKNNINKNYFIESLNSNLKEINELIQKIDPYNYFSNDSSLLKKLFGNSNKKELKDFIINFNLYKIKLDYRLEVLKLKLKEIENEIKKINKNIEELEDIKKELIIKNNIIDNMKEHITDTNFLLEMNLKQQNILELINIVEMTIKSLKMILDNYISYKEIINKLVNITKNALNLGALLFVNSKFKTLDELIINKNNEFENFINKVEEIKKLAAN